MTEINVPEAQFEVWKQNHVTKLFLQAVAGLLANKGKDMGKGVMLNCDSADNTQALTGMGVGYCQALNKVLEIGPLRVRVKKKRK